jgi:hypothetical protein
MSKFALNGVVVVVAAAVVVVVVVVGQEVMLKTRPVTTASVVLTAGRTWTVEVAVVFVSAQVELIRAASTAVPRGLVSVKEGKIK